MSLIDINAYIGNWPYWPVPHRSPRELVALMDRHGVASAAVCSLRGVFSDWRMGNEETLAAARAHAGRLIPFATLGPTGGWSAAEVPVLAGLGFRGIRLYPLFHTYPLSHPVAGRICAAAGRHGLPVVVPIRPMMNWRFATVPIEQVQVLAKGHRKTRFILAGVNYLIEFESALRCLEACPNVSIETSALQGFDAIRLMARGAGAGRVLFGTAAPLQAMPCNVAKLQHARLTTAERRAIGSENALRLCGLLRSSLPG